MSSKRLLLVAAAAVFVAVVALYLPTLRGGFVYDSIAQVLYSDYIHTPSHWVDVLTLRVVGQDELDRNRPLHLASLMLDAAIWGKNPFGYRLTSVLFHALNASLLFVFISLALQRTNPRGLNVQAGVLCAAFGALFFALHPLVVEAVAEPSNREDLLVLLPVLIGLLCLAAPVHSRFAVNAALVVCSFLAVLAKESGVTVPFVFAVACWLWGTLRRCLPGLIGSFLAVGAFLAASYVFRPESSGILTNPPAPLAESFWMTLAVQSRIWTLQFWQILWPWNLSAHYPPASIGVITEPLAFGVLVIALIAVVFLWRISRLAALGVAIYVLALLPASNLVPQYHPIADRYLYVPLAGLGMIAAAMAHRLRSQYPSRFAGGMLVFAALAIIGSEYAANLRRQILWQEPANLWTDVLRQHPDTAQAHLGMANASWRGGDYAAAWSSANEAVINSSGAWAEPFALRAICGFKTGNREQALEDFLQAGRLSRVYESEESMSKAMIFSTDQLAVLGELMRGTGP